MLYFTTFPQYHSVCGIKQVKFSTVLPFWQVTCDLSFAIIQVPYHFDRSHAIWHITCYFFFCVWQAIHHSRRACIILTHRLPFWQAICHSDHLPFWHIVAKGGWQIYMSSVANHRLKGGISRYANEKSRWVQHIHWMPGNQRSALQCNAIISAIKTVVNSSLVYNRSWQPIFLLQRFKHFLPWHRFQHQPTSYTNSR